MQIPSGLKSQAWFTYSNASHHITFSPLNLQCIKSYEGTNKVVVGNGHTDVKTVGHTLFHLNIVSNFLLKLTDLLHVPNITQNRISASKFYKDNHAYFEFHPN